VQHCELASAAQSDQGLGRIKKETAGEQRHQSERGEIGSIGSGQSQCLITRLTWRNDSQRVADI
jgi:hypothetical protein